MNERATFESKREKGCKRKKKNEKTGSNDVDVVQVQWEIEKKTFSTLFLFWRSSIVFFSMVTAKTKENKVTNSVSSKRKENTKQRREKKNEGG